MPNLLTRFERFLKRKVTKQDRRRLLHAAAWLALAGIAAFSVLLFYLSRSLPSSSDISNHVVTESTKIYDRTGTVLLYEISAGQRRTVVPLSEMSPYLKDATIAIEDKNFYNEPAFSIRGILRAIFQNLVHGGVSQGGSTITQQLARNAFLSDTQTFSRKLKELILAVQLDRQYTKDKIIEMYLNEVPYGPTTYGVEGASQLYFNKPARDLTLAESAILVSLPQAPSLLSPWGSHLDLLFNRQHLVLKAMLDQGKISQAEYQAALGQQIVFATQSQYGIKAPHFVLTVQDYLLQKYGEDAVRNGGLKVKTTLDWTMEQAAEKAVSEGAAANLAKYGGSNAALVAEDSSTGQILALVGSHDYFDKANGGSYNVAIQGLRQPGSALKPFVYATAFSKGYTPNTVLFDLPTEFSENAACPAIPNLDSTDRRCFHPQNFEGSFQGPMSIRNALAQSENIPAVEMLYLVGIKNAIQTMNSFGISTLDDPNKYGLTLTLGGGAVHLIDLVKAYAVLSQEGVLHEQSMILEVRDKDDNLLESFQDSSSRVYDQQPIREVNDILSDADARAPLFGGSQNQTVYPGYDVALKTGTSNDYRDAWSIGYTPSLVVGVWAGNNNNQPMHKQGSSILAAVPIWHTFMVEALKTQPTQAFMNPDPIAETKPALIGECTDANNTPHTILFCVDPADPTGPMPQNPGSDPQFHNWEVAVENWVGTHPVAPPSDTSTSTIPGDPNSTSTAQLPPFFLPPPVPTPTPFSQPTQTITQSP
jgi:penicillin-binding protein 1C